MQFSQKHFWGEHCLFESSIGCPLSMANRCMKNSVCVGPYGPACLECLWHNVTLSYSFIPMENFSVIQSWKKEKDKSNQVMKYASNIYIGQSNQFKSLTPPPLPHHHTHTLAYRHTLIHGQNLSYFPLKTDIAEGQNKALHQLVLVLRSRNLPPLWLFAGINGLTQCKRLLHYYNYSKPYLECWWILCPPLVFHSQWQSSWII